MVVVVWARHTLPVMHFEELDDLEALQRYVQEILISGPVPYLLFPFRLAVRPFLAPNAAAFAWALGPALMLALLHYWWVMRSDVAFEEASADASKKLADKLAAVRAGNWQGTKRQAKGRRAPFVLRPLGPAPIALLWKNLISAGQAFTLRVWVTLAAIAIGVVWGPVVS